MDGLAGQPDPLHAAALPEVRTLEPLLSRGSELGNVTTYPPPSGAGGPGVKYVESLGYVAFRDLNSSIHWGYAQIRRAEGLSAFL